MKKKLFILILSILSSTAYTQELQKWNSSREYYFRTEIKLGAFSEEGKELKIWVPHPATHETQSVERILYQTPWSGRVTQDKTSGNQMVFLVGKTTTLPAQLAIHFKVTRHPKSFLDFSSGEPATPEKFKELKKIFDSVKKSGTSECVDAYGAFLDSSAKIIFGFKLPFDHNQGIISKPYCWIQKKVDGDWYSVDGKGEFGLMASQYIEMSRSRTTTLEPPSQNGAIEDFILPYIEVDGSSFSDVEVKWTFSKIRSFKK